MPTGTATYELGECIKLDAVAEFEVTRHGIEYLDDSLFVSVENGDEFHPGNIMVTFGKGKPERLYDFLVASCEENLE